MYGYTYQFDRHLYRFIGPFKTQKELLESIGSLVLDDESGAEYIIKDYIENDIEYIEDMLDIKIYCLEEEKVDFSILCDLWRKNIEKRHIESSQSAEAYERAAYERLKEKYGAQETNLEQAINIIQRALDSADASEFQPDWASPPGDSIKDILREREIDKDYFMEEIGLNYKQFDDLMTGRIPIYPKLASRLVGVLGGTPEFWMARDVQYRNDLIRLRKRDGSED